MVLVLGLDELVPVRNVERLKRDLRSCFGLLDALLSPKWGGGLGPPCWPSPPRPPGMLCRIGFSDSRGGPRRIWGVCFFGGSPGEGQFWAPPAGGRCRNRTRPS
ncbi:protein fuzzy homolog [Acridotheres tristis]